MRLLEVLPGRGIPLSGRIGEGDSALVDVDDDKQVVIRKQGDSAVAIPALAGASA
jgi:ATP-dependent Clp protease ATP-binding subunit ClpC